MPIKLLVANYIGERRFAVSFSDGSSGVLDIGKYLMTRSGPLLLPLAEEAYLRRGFVEAGALAWPNGLEISPERLYGLSELVRNAA